MDVDTCNATGLVLPSGLRFLSLLLTERAGAAVMMAGLLEDTGWAGCRDLQVLSLEVDQDLPGAPVRVDLGFLRELPNLLTLEIVRGIVHAGPDPWPLEPPFDGLSSQLRRVRYESTDAEATGRALRDKLPGASVVSVSPVVVTEATTPWEVTASDATAGVWLAYGRLNEGAPGDTEYDACERARKRIGTTDAELAARLEFDPEADGTGIEASSREDLERALKILGLV